MAKTIQCERCRKKYKFDNNLAGKTVSCPNCQLPLSIPGERWVEPAIEGVPPVPPQKPPAIAAEDRPVFHEAPPVNFWHVFKVALPEHRGLWIAAFLFFLCVVGLIRTPKVLLFESALVAGAIYGLIRLCLAGWSNKLLAFRISFAACCAAGLCYFFTATDSDVRRFNDGIYDNRVEHVTRRWNGQWLRGSHSLQREGIYEHGPLSQSGKSHGEWTVMHNIDGKPRVLSFWYWYGDQISEGEWVLRNK